MLRVVPCSRAPSRSRVVREGAEQKVPSNTAHLSQKDSFHSSTYYTRDARVVGQNNFLISAAKILWLQRGALKTHMSETKCLERLWGFEAANRWGKANAILVNITHILQVQVRRIADGHVASLPKTFNNSLGFERVFWRR